MKKIARLIPKTKLTALLKSYLLTKHKIIRAVRTNSTFSVVKYSELQNWFSSPQLKSRNTGVRVWPGQELHLLLPVLDTEKNLVGGLAESGSTNWGWENLDVFFYDSRASR